MPDVLHPEGGPDEDDDLSEQRGLDDGDFVVATTAHDAIAADLLAGACEEAGIPAIVRSPKDSMVGKIDDPGGTLEILVRTTDLARAQAILTERKAQLETDQSANAQAAEEEEAAEEAAAAAPPKPL